LIPGTSTRSARKATIDGDNDKPLNVALHKAGQAANLGKDTALLMKRTLKAAAVVANSSIGGGWHMIANDSKQNINVDRSS